MGIFNAACIETGNIHASHSDFSAVIFQNTHPCSGEGYTKKLYFVKYFDVSKPLKK